MHRGCPQADGTRGYCGKKYPVLEPNPERGVGEHPKSHGINELPGTSQKKTRNMQQTSSGVYWGVVYRPGESQCAEIERADCVLLKKHFVNC